jgi:hypothetical protein
MAQSSLAHRKLTVIQPAVERSLGEFGPLRPPGDRRVSVYQGVALVLALAGLTDADVEGHARQRCAMVCDQAHPFGRINVVGAEPGITPAAAHHRVLIAADRAPTGVTLGGDHGRGGVGRCVGLEHSNDPF